jgi:hypothetical protein
MSIDELMRQAAEWLDADRNGRGASLNTLAGVVVILDRLIDKAPLTDTEIITADGQLAGGEHTCGLFCVSTASPMISCRLA